MGFTSWSSLLPNYKYMFSQFVVKEGGLFSHIWWMSPSAFCSCPVNYLILFSWTCQCTVFICSHEGKESHSAANKMFFLEMIFTHGFEPFLPGSCHNYAIELSGTSIPFGGKSQRLSKTLILQATMQKFNEILVVPLMWRVTSLLVFYNYNDSIWKLPQLCGIPECNCSLELIFAKRILIETKVPPMDLKISIPRRTYGS